MSLLQEFIEKYEKYSKSTAKDISISLNVSEGYYSQIKKGKKLFTQDIVKGIADVFDVDPQTRKKLYIYSFLDNKQIKIDSNSEMYEYIISLIKKDIGME